MRPSDLIRTALGGLWRQKGRTLLTLIGVAVGGCALAFSLSLGIGLRALIDHEFQSRETYWQVHVRVKHEGSGVPESEIPPEKIAVVGEMSEDRRQRLKQMKIQEYQSTQPRKPPTPLSPQKLAELAALPDVVEVQTVHSGAGRVWLGEKTREMQVVAIRMTEPELERRVIFGRLPANPDADEIVVSEYLLYELGVRDDAAVAAILGKPLRIGINVGLTPHYLMAHMFGVAPRELSSVQDRALLKITTQLSEVVDRLDLSPAERVALKAMLAERDRKKKEPAGPSEASAEGEFRVAAVFRSGLTPEEEKGDSNFGRGGWVVRYADVLLPPGSGDRLFGQLPWVKESGYESVTLRVRPGGELKAVAEAAEAMGYSQYSAAEWHDSVKREVTLIAAGLNLFALVALFIAALGITNTLVTTVVERTREIGIFKALGATDRQVLILFLTEGAVIGLLGGILGLGLAWALSIPGDGFVRHLIQEQSRETILSSSVFEFPVWLVTSTVVFATLVTTLAALYPARRAARIQPVEALRHE